MSAADDAYLKMLESEAAEVHLDESGQLNTNEMEVEAPAAIKNINRHWGTGDGLAAGLQKAEFEQALQDNYYGTYVFYKKLNSIDRDTVFHRYATAEAASIENVRNNILELIRK